MYSLIITLQVLDLLALTLQVLWLTLALGDVFSSKTRLLRLALLSALKTLSNALPLPIPTAPPTQNIIYSPSFALHQFAYNIINREHPAFPPHCLRGSKFVPLAERLLAGEDVFGAKFKPHHLERAKDLAALPELMVTPPEDGHRMPERGERGGKKVKVEEGRLAVPVRVNRAGGREKQRRRAWRKARALEDARRGTERAEGVLVGDLAS